MQAAENHEKDEKKNGHVRSLIFYDYLAFGQERLGSVVERAVYEGVVHDLISLTRGAVDELHQVDELKSCKSKYSLASTLLLLDDLNIIKS